MASLSSHLFEEIRPDFFRILGFENAALYLDAVDALAAAMPRRGEGLTRAEAVEIVADLLRMNPELRVEAETAEADSLSGRSNTVLNKLTASGWLEEPERSDYRRQIFLDANAEILLEAIRKIAQPDPAQFTGLLRMACGRLAEEEAVTTFSWEDLEACLANLESGLRELKAMSKSVERLTRKQLGTASLDRSVAIVYGDFSSEIANKCYRELVRAHLPEKLVEARRGLDRLLTNEAVLTRLQDGLMHHRKSLEPALALVEVARVFEAVESALGNVEPLTDRVDARTAEFARRSRARIHYLSSVGSARARQVEAVFGIMGERFAGQRLALAETDLDLPGLRIGDTATVSADSLRTPPAQRTITEVDAIADDVTDEERERALSAMEGNIAFSVTVDRAHRFLDEIGCTAGMTISTSEMSLRATSDTIEDLVSVLLYADTEAARYDVRVTRVEDGAVAYPADRIAGYEIDRFEVTRRG